MMNDVSAARRSSDFSAFGYLQPETRAAIEKLPRGTISEASMALGVRSREPLLVAMDAMLRYAKAYQRHVDGMIAEDGFAADPFLDIIKGLRALLNMDGAVAMEQGVTTDSKDNGVIEDIFWATMRATGFKESDL